MVNALKAMYKSVKLCVKYKNNYSEFFASHTGVKQGDLFFPILFIYFINDLALTLNTDEENSVKINDINIFLLLFADDAVLFSKSPDSLQSMLDKLQEYSSFWSLNVNKEKNNDI